jgi:hypothetical protein
MGLVSEGPKVFTCPKCRKVYLGHDPLPDCPACGFDYRERSGFRWDVLVYLLVSSSYRSLLTGTMSRGEMTSSGEKLPGAGRPVAANGQSYDARR